jgi:hypothetical protein
LVALLFYALHHLILTPIPYDRESGRVVDCKVQGKDKQLQLTGTTGAFVGTCTWESRERADQYLYIFTKSLGSVSVWMPSVGFLPTLIPLCRMTINRKAASFFIVSKGESLQTMRI